WRVTRPVSRGRKQVLLRRCWRRQERIHARPQSISGTRIGLCRASSESPGYSMRRPGTACAVCPRADNRPVFLERKPQKGETAKTIVYDSYFSGSAYKFSSARRDYVNGHPMRALSLLSEEIMRNLFFAHVCCLPMPRRRCAGLQPGTDLFKGPKVRRNWNQIAFDTKFEFDETGRLRPPSEG